MSDISKKIFPVEPTPDEDPIAIVPEISDDTVQNPQETSGGPKNSGVEDAPKLPLRRIDDVPEPVFRPIMHLVKPVEDAKKDGLSEKLTITTEPIAETVSFITDETPEAPDEPADKIILPERRSALSPMRIETPEPQSGLGWIGPSLVVLTGLSVAALIVAFAGTQAVLTPLNMGIMAAAAVVPMLTALAFWMSLRAFSKARSEANRLATISQKLVSVDETVADDVTRLSTAIRLELARVEERLAQTRNEVEAVSKVLMKQFSDADSLVRGISSRSENISKAAHAQKQSVDEMSGLLETRLTKLTETLSQTSKEVSDLTEAASDCIDKSTNSLKEATVESAETADHLVDQTQRLLQSQEQIESRIEALSSTYEQRIKQTEGLAKRLSDEASSADQTLTQQAVHLTSVNSQIESMESRLTALIDHAKSIQEELSSRLAEIDKTMRDANSRSSEFVSGLSGRIEDSLSLTKREISSLETDVSSLQSRMSSAQSEPDAQPHLDLLPMDDSFADELAIPEIEDPSAADPDEDQILTLSEPIEFFDEAPTSRLRTDDIVTRPGNVEAPINPKGQDKNWRWRDMLGGLDHPASPPEPQETRKVDRPGPGVPLSLPSSPHLSVDSKAIIARLKEVELSPAQTIDDLVIQKAASARLSGGEDAQSSAVFAHSNAAVIHLRGVLAADPHFRARAENFRREFNDALQSFSTVSELTKTLSKEGGRAYLLCAAAFFRS